MSLMRHPVLFVLPGLCIGLTLAFGALHRVDPEPPAGVPLWSGDSFATLSWLGLVVLVFGVLVAQRYAANSADALAFSGLGAQALLLSAGMTIALAVAAECQNYWDAYHFSSLAWTFALASLISLLVVRRASSLGSEIALVLRMPATAFVLVSLFGWTWTWSSSLQAFLSDVARTLFLATHG